MYTALAVQVAHSITEMRSHIEILRRSITLVRLRNLYVNLYPCRTSRQKCLSKKHRSRKGKLLRVKSIRRRRKRILILKVRFTRKNMPINMQRQHEIRLVPAEGEGRVSRLRKNSP